MAILEYAMRIQELTKYGNAGSANGIVATAPSNHPFILGNFDAFMDYDAYTTVAGKYTFNFSADANKPVNGDVFGFRYSRICYSNNGETSNQTANQWIFQFLDASGNTLGGLRHNATIQNITAKARGYELVAGSTVVAIAGSILFPYTTCDDYAITCSVTTSTITVSMYRADNTASLAGSAMSLIGTVSNSNSTLSYGPVASMKITPCIGTATGSYGGNRYGADSAAYCACAFTVNEDLANTFISNTLSLTTTSASLTDLPMLSSAIVESNNYANFSAYLQATRDLRRTFKLAPSGAHAFPSSGYQIARLKANIGYGLSVAAKQVIGTNSDLEFFTRYSSVNYSNGKFGNNTGTAQFEILYNPATTLPFDNYGAVELGIVLREKT